jgi:hypothetical protein
VIVRLPTILCGTPRNHQSEALRIKPVRSGPGILHVGAKDAEKIRGMARIYPVHGLQVADSTASFWTYEL